MNAVANKNLLLPDNTAPIWEMKTKRPDKIYGIAEALNISVSLIVENSSFCDEKSVQQLFILFCDEITVAKYRLFLYLK